MKIVIVGPYLKKTTSKMSTEVCRDRLRTNPFMRRRKLIKKYRQGHLVCCRKVLGSRQNPEAMNLIKKLLTESLRTCL